ncbi:hypothetical protein B1991_11825 [Rhodanobacter lindaniclasticus]|uniref:Uncharacterized protein n=2 Tax=Rhodanobacter lindaniclasticus TaxID=75310 RepID=A0A4S3KDX1_9GAMM|nr:hypothetical protein B1991_11825 [Rhodanobacter lindaniclasticus]
MSGRSRGGRRAWRVLMLACIPLTAAGVDGPVPPVPAPPALGVHTLLAQADHRGRRPAVTVPLDTAPTGSALLVLNGGFASNAVPPTDSYGRHWTQVGPTAVYDGYQGRFDVKAYVSLAGPGGPHHTVSIDKPGEPDREITIPFVEIRHAAVLQDFAQNYPAPTLTQRIAGKLKRTLEGMLSEPDDRFSVTSGEVATTGPATLIAVWWGDGNVRQMSAVPDNGFTVIDSYLQLPPISGVQCAVAYRQVDRAGTYRVSWSGSPRQRAILWLFAFQSAAAP